VERRADRAGLKALLRTVDTLWHAIGRALDPFSPAESARYLAPTTGYRPPYRNML